MFHEELLMTQVFRILNVAVFLGAVIYQIRKHMGSVYAAIAQQTQQKKDLRAEGVILEKVVDTIHNEAEAQHQWLAQMENNLVQWDKAVRTKQEQEKQEYEARLERLKKITDVQYQALQVLEAEQSLMPSVITTVEDQLTHTMKGEKGKRYVEQLIAFFKKAKS
jgi:hypothetical protein